jgi:hypothetical protein
MPFVRLRRQRRGELLRARCTFSANCDFGQIASTRPQATAFLPRMPSAIVQNTSARSRRTLRLSTRRVRPPVPGSTPSSGTSGSDTAELLSLTRWISSHASASS